MTYNASVCLDLCLHLLCVSLTDCLHDIEQVWSWRCANDSGKKFAPCTNAQVCAFIWVHGFDCWYDFNIEAIALSAVWPCFLLSTCSFCVYRHVHVPRTCMRILCWYSNSIFPAWLQSYFRHTQTQQHRSQMIEMPHTGMFVLLSHGVKSYVFRSIHKLKVLSDKGVWARNLQNMRALLFFLVSLVTVSARGGEVGLNFVLTIEMTCRVACGSFFPHPRLWLSMLLLLTQRSLSA